MSFFVWNASNPSDREEWLRAWREWPDREAFAHPAYAQLYETEGDRAVCAAWCDGRVTALMPLLVRRISLAGEPPHYDLSTPYGYGGPFVWGETGSDRLVPRFWEEYAKWTSQLGAVSEFLRFNLFPDALLDAYPGEKVCRMMNVVRELELPAEELWQDFNYKVRKNVKRAQASGVKIIHDPDGKRIGDFLRIYRRTMARRQASEAYAFPTEYFREIQDGLKGCHTFFHAAYEGSVIASELVLLSARRAYSFLGGTDEDYFSYRPNDLLKVGIIDWCRETGRREFVLGGGYQPADGIFRYKLSFAPSGQKEFQIGRRVVDHGLYDALVKRRYHRDPEWRPQPDYFPAYRA